MSTPLFHATTKEFDVDDLITANQPSRFYPKVANLLNAHRPTGMPDREICLFATSASDFAIYFLRKQQVAFDDINLYRVKMETFHTAPFAIVHAIERRIEACEDTSALVGEYWKSAENWRFFECFGPKMRVMEKMEPTEPNGMLMAHWYGQDFERAIRIGS